jgi:Cys-tRNA(Pro)/Cys-tRNA(Cys) deacylase
VVRAATPAIAASHAWAHAQAGDGGPQVAAGAPHEVLQYHHDPRTESFGEEAAQALAREQGVDAAQDVAVNPQVLIRLTNAITADIRA